MAHPSIRNAELTDVPAMLAIEANDEYSPWTEQLLIDAVQHQQYHTWVLAQDEQVIGYGICYIPHDECHLMNIAMAPEYRGQGYGRQIVDYMLTAVKPLADYVILEVRAENQIAQQLYTAVGFEQIGIRRNYYQQGSGNRDALVYRLDLK